MTIVWGVIFVLTIIIEAETAELVSIWFMPGSVIALILSIYDVKTWIQWTVFIAVSAILLILAKTVFRKKLIKSSSNLEKTDTDLLIGKTAVVVEQINNVEAVGSVKVNGNTWTARMENENDTALPGDKVVVVKITGVKLICRK